MQGTPLGRWVRCDGKFSIEKQQNFRYEFMGPRTAKGITPSTLLSCSGATVDMVMLSWLHTMDQGVLADVIGNVFWDELPLLHPPPR